MRAHVITIARAALVAVAVVAAAACTTDDDPPPRNPLAATPDATSDATAATPAPPPPDPSPTAIQPPVATRPPASTEGGPSPDVLEALVGNALQLVSGWLGWDPTHFEVVESESVVWSDGCMGVEAPGVFCTQALVPGFRAVFEDGHGGRHRAHGDAEGRVVRWVGERLITGTIVDGTRHYIDIATAEGTVRVNAAPGSRYSGPGLSPTTADLRPVADAVGDAEVAVAADPAADGSEALVIAWLVVLE